MMSSKTNSIVRWAMSLLCVGQVGTQLSFGQAPAIANPISNWTYLNHSSTAAEGYLRGQASVASSMAEYNYLTSIAAVNRQEAIRRAIENSRLYVKTYYELKQIRAEYNERYAPRPLPDEARKRIQESYLPARLTETQYDRQNNRLYWPHILRQSQFDSLRDHIDDLFSARTPEDSGDGSPNERKIDESLRVLSALVDANVDKMTSSQFISAKDYIRSVAFEAKQVIPAKSAPVAPPTPEPEKPVEATAVVKPVQE